MKVVIKAKIKNHCKGELILSQLGPKKALMMQSSRSSFCAHIQTKCRDWPVGLITCPILYTHRITCIIQLTATYNNTDSDLTDYWRRLILTLKHNWLLVYLLGIIPGTGTPYITSGKDIRIQGIACISPLKCNFHFFTGDAVSFVAEKSPSDCPTKWVAKQVLINDETGALLQKAKAAQQTSDRTGETEST